MPKIDDEHEVRLKENEVTRRSIKTGADKVSSSMGRYEAAIRKTDLLLRNDVSKPNKYNRANPDRLGKFQI